jgi:cyclohexyl-isocyanide hydratase
MLMTMEDHSLSRRDLIRLLALTAAGTCAAPSQAAPTNTHNAAVHAAQPQLRMGSEQIAILVYPEFTALDALGPHYFLAGMMGATVRFVAKTKDIVPCEGATAGGFCIRPHMTFADCPEELDLLLIPGGVTGTLAAIADEKTRRFVADRGSKAKLAGSVCTGSLILGAAGLLKGRRATSHWQTIDVLKDVGATPVSERIVTDRTDRITAAGVSAGLDLGVELIRRFRGDFYAKGMQLLGEYDPKPPFPGGGNPATADKVVVDMLNMMHDPLTEQFRQAIAKAR